ncbi:MAG: hypothetical protein D6802_07805 [Ardenticatenia bacterium]|nr:MAG: hypothetical protein D6802_07805 [Ardenticatenia bacterium]
MFEWRTLDEEPTQAPPPPTQPRQRRSILVLALLLLIAGISVLVWTLYQRQQARLIADIQTTMRALDAAANTRRTETLLRHLDPTAPLGWHAARIDDFVKLETVWRTTTVENATWLSRDRVLADVRTIYTTQPPQATPLLTTTQRLGMRLINQTWRVSPIPEQAWGEPTIETTPHFRILYRDADTDLARLLASNVEMLAATVHTYVGDPMPAAAHERLSIILTTDQNGLQPSLRQPVFDNQLVLTSPVLLERYDNRAPEHLAQEIILWWLTMHAIHNRTPDLFDRTATSLFTPARQGVLLWLAEQSGLLPNDPLLAAYQRIACTLEWPALTERARASQSSPYHAVALPGFNAEADKHVAHAYVLVDVLAQKGVSAGDLLTATYQQPTWELVAAHLPTPISLSELDRARIRWRQTACAAATTAP